MTDIQISPHGSKGPIREGIGCLLQAIALSLIVLAFYIGEAILKGIVQI